MYEFEYGEPTFDTCTCCGTRATRLTRFVTRDGRPWSVYHAAFCEAPGAGGYVSVLAGFGEWTSEEPAEARTAFAFQLRPLADGVATSFVGPSGTVWDRSVLGQILSREAALVHPLRAEAVRLSDEILAQDTAVLARIDAIHAA